MRAALDKLVVQLEKPAQRSMQVEVESRGLKRPCYQQRRPFAHHRRDGIDWQRLSSALDNQRVRSVGEVAARID